MTSYEPTTLDKLRANPKFLDPGVLTSNVSPSQYWSSDCAEYYQKKLADYKKEGYQHFSGILTLAREIPAPGVMYSSVSIKEEYNGENINGKKIYEFEVPSQDMIQYEVSVCYNVNDGGNSLCPVPVSKLPVWTINEGTTYNPKPVAGPFSERPLLPFEYHRGKSTLKILTSSLGNLKRMAVHDEENRLISETRNIYLYDDPNFENELSSKFDNIGRVEQVFFESRAKAGGGGYNLENSSSCNYTCPDQKMKNNPDDCCTDNSKIYIKEVATKRVEFPNILCQTITTQSGITTKTTNKAFDFYTGAVTKTETEDSYGNLFETVTTPAYQVNYNNGSTLRYPTMGLKVITSTNKHMLTQEGESYSYKIEPDNEVKSSLGGSVTTWNDNWDYWEYNSSTGWKIVPSSTDPHGKIWRKHKSYTWKSFVEDDGTIDLSKFAKFDWTPNATQNPGWQMTEEITLYDHYSHPMEAMDINGHYATNRMGKEQGAIYASASNARMREIAFSGMEEDVDLGYLACEVEVKDGTVNTNPLYIHTGERSMQLSSNQKGYAYGGTIGTALTDYFRADRTYRASVWVYTSSEHSGKTKLFAKIDNTKLTTTISDPLATKAGNWTQLNIEADLSAYPNASTLSFGTERDITTVNAPAAYLDDFRVHPITAPMTSYVYDPSTDLLTAILDAENFASVFHYDAGGRLIKTEQEQAYIDVNQKGGLRTVSEYKYNYGNYLRAQFTATPDHTVTNSPITFEAIQQMAPAVAVNYVWNFGDGSTASGANPPPHSYSSKGVYTVSLTVLDNKGCTNQISKDIYISFPTLTAIISGVSYQECTPAVPPSTTPGLPPPVTFTVTPSGGDGTYSYAWSVSHDGGNTFAPRSSTSSTLLDGGYDDNYVIRCQIDDDFSVITRDFGVIVSGCNGEW